MEDIFDGMDVEELSDSVRAKIQRNAERALARSTLAAAEMTLGSDISLIGLAPDGSEEEVHASSAVLKRVSSGIRGIIEQCGEHRKIRMLTPGSKPRLQSADAVRFVLKVVHASEAQRHGLGEAALPASSFSEVPPLDILLGACQIADCWDFMAVLSTVADCVPLAAALPTACAYPGETASALVRMLRMCPTEPEPGHESGNEHWLRLRSALELTIAQRVDVGWLPAMLKSFSLEASARVINQIEDLKVELPSVVLRGASALEAPWYKGESCRLGASHGTAAKRGGEVRARFRSSLALVVEYEEANADNEQGREHLRQLERLRQRWEQHLETPGITEETRSEFNRLLADVDEMIVPFHAPTVSVFIQCNGAAVALTGETQVRLVPDGCSRMHTGQTQLAQPKAKELGEYIVLPAGRQAYGWRKVVDAARLGGFTAECTAVISKLQLQFEVLARWQDMNGRKRSNPISHVVGVLQRLQSDAAIVKQRVQVLLGTTDYRYEHRENHVGVVLVPRAYTPSTDDKEGHEARMPAAALLCESMTRYMLLRLDDDNGPVNRATALLDKATMRRILTQTSFAHRSGPSSERALLHMAVQWARHPWRLPADINEVMEGIYFAGVPTKTLMHLDTGSGWTREKIAQTHTLREGLRELAYGCGAPLTGGVIQYKGFDRDEFELRVQEMIGKAIDDQRAGAHLEPDSELVRECFEAPRFPEGDELHKIMIAAAMGTTRLRERLAESGAEVKKLQLQLQQHAEAKDEAKAEAKSKVEEVYPNGDPKPKGRKRRRYASHYDGIRGRIDFALATDERLGWGE